MTKIIETRASPVMAIPIYDWRSSATDLGCGCGTLHAVPLI